MLRQHHQVNIPNFEQCISLIKNDQVGLVDALDASLKTATPSIRLKVAALLRIFISSKHPDVISLVLALGCSRLFAHVIQRHLRYMMIALALTRRA
jgi:hypothetical protein